MLKGKNIFLRATERSDVDYLFRWENDTDLWHLSTTLVPYSKEQLETFIDLNFDINLTKQFRFMIDTNTNPSEVVGCIDLFEYDSYHKRAGVGVLIEEKYREKGYAQEALDILINYAFSVLDLKQLYCSILKDNEASIKLFKK